MGTLVGRVTPVFQLRLVLAECHPKPLVQAQRYAALTESQEAFWTNQKHSEDFVFT